ncbi:MAG: Holliday junction resolvase RuvX [Kiritimatiellia bacterium]
MRIAGIDPGEKRIGIALGDTLLGVATPAGTIRITGQRDAVRKLEAFVREKEAGAVVVGLPLNLNGTRGPAAEKATAFAEALRKVLTVPVHAWDERLTTAGMHREMIEAGVRRDRRGEMVDQLAAQQILQSYLDARARPHEHTGDLPPDRIPER